MGRRPKNPATKLASLRLELGMTQTEFATMLGIDRSKLSRAESKDEIPDDLKSIIESRLGSGLSAANKNPVGGQKTVRNHSSQPRGATVPVDFYISATLPNNEKIALFSEILQKLASTFEASTTAILDTTITFRCPSDMNRDDFMLKLGAAFPSQKRQECEDPDEIRIQVGDYPNDVSITTRSPRYLKNTNASLMKHILRKRKIDFAIKRSTQK